MTDEELYRLHEGILQDTDRAWYREGLSAPDIPDSGLLVLPIVAFYLVIAIPLFLYKVVKGCLTGKLVEELPYFGDNHRGSPW